MPSQPKFAALVAVGPSPAEIDRVSDLVDSLAAYEPGPWYFVMVDDGRADRDLVRQIRFPLNASPVSVLHDRTEQKSGYTKAKGICSVILTGLNWIARHAEDARFTLKLDTDALVIAPLAQRIAAAMDANPDVGMLGAYSKTPNGTDRDISRNAAIIRNLHKPPIPWMRPRMAYRALRDRITGGTLAEVRRHLTAARRNGYAYGEHCLGGAYAVSNELVRRTHDRGFLTDPSLWLNIDSPEDVMLGMYTKATGLRHMNCVDAGEVFGVRHEGLPFELPELVSRGYGVIHSIKNDKRYSEREVRDFFAARRQGAAAA